MSPALKYWDGSAWQTLVGAPGAPGYTPSSKAFGLFTFSAADNAHRIYAPAIGGKPWDEIGGFPAVGQPLIFTAPKAGRYAVLTKIAQVSAAGQINVSPIVNDATPGNGVTATVNPKADTAETGGCECFCILDLAVGNTIKFFGCHSGGGTAYIIFEIIQLSAVPQTIITSIPLVTSLPTAPVDGQEVYYVADATNGIIWHLRYRAASASAYKWEVLGGPPLEAYVDTAESSASTTYVDLTTVGPQITVPLAGDYDVDLGASCFPNTATAENIWTAPKIGAAATSDNDGEYAWTNAANQSINVHRRLKKTGIAASTVIKQQYRTVAGVTSNWRRRYLRVTPVRVG